MLIKELQSLSLDVKVLTETNEEIKVYDDSEVSYEDTNEMVYIKGENDMINETYEDEEDIEDEDMDDEDFELDDEDFDF